MIALLGLDAETGVFMLLFLDLSYERVPQGRDGCASRADLDEAILHGAVKRVRPKMMTVAAAFMGLLPIMWSTSAGADVMKRIAAPMIGGLVTSFLLELLVYPAVFKLWKLRQARSDASRPAATRRGVNRVASDRRLVRQDDAGEAACDEVVEVADLRTCRLGVAGQVLEHLAGHQHRDGAVSGFDTARRSARGWRRRAARPGRRGRSRWRPTRAAISGSRPVASRRSTLPTTRQPGACSRTHAASRPSS